MRWNISRKALYFAIPSVLLAIGLALAAASDRGISSAGFILSAVAGLSTVPVFYTMPAAILRGPAAAGGLALIKAIGNVGGYLGLLLVGWMAQRTGSLATGLVAIAVAVSLAPSIAGSHPNVVLRSRRRI